MTSISRLKKHDRFQEVRNFKGAKKCFMLQRYKNSMEPSIIKCRVPHKAGRPTKWSRGQSGRRPQQQVAEWSPQAARTDLDHTSFLAEGAWPTTPLSTAQV